MKHVFHLFNGILGAAASWSGIAALISANTIDLGLRLAYSAVMLGVGLVTLAIGIRNFRNKVK